MSILLDKIKEFMNDDTEEIKLNHVFEEKESSKRKMRKEINSLKGENEVLKNAIKDELYKTFMDKLGEPLEMDRLRTENKSLRKKIKTLKEIIKEDNSKEKRNKRK